MRFQNRIYRFTLKKICLISRVLLRKSVMESGWYRKLYNYTYKVDVGLYSYGCFDPSRIPEGTKIGRYCSFSPTCYRFSRNHGLSYLSLHPYLYNARLGVIPRDKLEKQICVFEDDIWVGYNVSILPAVKFIGRGSVIAGGAIVTKDVPRYAIVAGNPARVIKYRFDDETIGRIENTKWWLLDKMQLKHFIDTYPEEVYVPERGTRNIGVL